MWTVQIKKQAIKKLKRIPEPDKGYLKAAIQSLETGPEGKDIQRLQGRPGYRMRVGDWRILMNIEKEVRLITIDDIGSRGDIYK